MSSPCFGIDLGTTASAIGLLERGGVLSSKRHIGTEHRWDIGGEKVSPTPGSSRAGRARRSSRGSPRLDRLAGQRVLYALVEDALS